VEKKKRPDSGSVTTQHRHTEDETVMAKEFKRHHVTIRNVQRFILVTTSSLWEKKLASSFRMECTLSILTERDR